MSEVSELSYIFSLCDLDRKGFITSEDIIKVGSEYGPELGTILSILRLGDGDRLTLEDFIHRVNESTPSPGPINSSSIEDQDSYLSPPSSDYTSGFGSSLTVGEAEEDFEDLDVSEVRYALRKLEDSLTVMKESQVDTKQDLALILESVTHMDRNDVNRRRIDKQHQVEIEKMSEKFELELNRQKELFYLQLSEKMNEVEDCKRRLSQALDEHNKEKELLRSEVESLKLVNVVLEQKLEFLKDSRSSENDEINRQWRQIQFDKDRLEDEKIDVGFQRICLATDSEDLQLEKKEFQRFVRSSRGDVLDPFHLYNELPSHFGDMQSENENLKLSFEESEFSNRELKKQNEDLKCELASAKNDILELRKKIDPLSSRNGLIGQFRETLQRKKDSKSRFTDIINAERHAHLERERELLQRNEDLSAQLSDIRKQRRPAFKCEPPKCIITEKDKEVNKQIMFEKKCLSLIIDDLKSTNQSLTDNLRILEKENNKFRSRLNSELEDKPVNIQNANHLRPRVFSNTSLKPSKDPAYNVPSISKSMSSLNIY